MVIRYADDSCIDLFKLSYIDGALFVFLLPGILSDPYPPGRRADRLPYPSAVIPFADSWQVLTRLLLRNGK
jgi:hypothetical protein